MHLGCRILGLLILCFVSTGNAQEKVFPASFLDGAAIHLAKELEKVPGMFPSEGARISSAKKYVAGFARHIYDKGANELISGAPTYDALSFPASTDPRLDAMGRYQFCNGVLALQTAPDSDQNDINLMFTGIVGTTALTMVVIYLGPMSGIKVEDMEAYLTSDSMGAIFDEIQTTASALDYVQKQCTPIVVEFVKAAVLEG